MEKTVGLVRCGTYSEEEVCKAFQDLMSLVGSDQPLVRRGERILVKPNLLMAHSADRGTCTHPKVVFAACRWLLDQGAKVLISDSPGFGSTLGVAKACGLLEEAKRLGVEVKGFRKVDALPHGLDLPGVSPTLNIASLLREVDGIFNLAKCKAHGQLRISLSVKNLFGLVPGKRKTVRHLAYTRSVDAFCSMIIANAHLVQPKLRFSLIDAVMAMHKSGPAGGEMRPLRFLAGSCDPFALDGVVCQILNIPLNDVSLHQAAARIGKVSLGLEDVRVAGESVDALRVLDFQLPEEMAPIGFSPFRVLKSSLRHLKVLIKEKLRDPA